LNRPLVVAAGSFFEAQGRTLGAVAAFFAATHATRDSSQGLFLLAWLEKTPATAPANAGFSASAAFIDNLTFIPRQCSAA
jgi:hypothetical protein